MTGGLRLSVVKLMRGMPRASPVGDQLDCRVAERLSDGADAIVLVQK